ncbi:hypothetical protein ACFYU9_36240 [Streptomyces sp. NPDC004327]|uniref:hypothetical protein n=1 Tax=unclassified Streptomyces TaxID=2593676 RepID=UPI00369AC995
MISEPELVGGPAFPDAAPPPPYPMPMPAPEPPRAARPRRPWLWALGGAALASAVWAGGLYAYGTGDDARPGLGGYRMDRDPCTAARLEGLTSAIGPRETGEQAVHGEPLKVVQPALFEWECTVSLKGAKARYEVNIRYTLHKVTDPGPEFEATNADPQLGAGDRIDGVGEMAFAGGAWGENSLTVLDGQAVLTLIVQADDFDEDKGMPRDVPKLDPAAMRTYLVEDMRQLMAALKK